MGSTSALGVVSSTLESESPRDRAIALLQSVARFANVPIRDVLEDLEVVEVAPDGTVRSLVQDEGIQLGPNDLEVLDSDGTVIDALDIEVVGDPSLLDAGVGP